MENNKYYPLTHHQQPFSLTEADLFYFALLKYTEVVMVIT